MYTCMYTYLPPDFQQGIGSNMIVKVGVVWQNLVEHMVDLYNNEVEASLLASHICRTKIFKKNYLRKLFQQKYCRPPKSNLYLTVKT